MRGCACVIYMGFGHNFFYFIRIFFVFSFYSVATHLQHTPSTQISIYDCMWTVSIQI